MHIQLWLYLGGGGLIGIGIQYFLFFWACPAELKKTAAQNLDLKFSLFAILGFMVFLGFLFFGLGLFKDVTENGNTALITGPWLVNGGVMFWGLIRCTKLRGNYKKELWQKQATPDRGKPTDGAGKQFSVKVPAGKTQPCPLCSAAISAQSAICRNCGYPVVEAPAPRRVRLKLNLNSLFILLFFLLGASVTGFIVVKEAYPVVAVKYFGIPAKAEIVDWCTNRDGRRYFLLRFPGGTGGARFVGINAPNAEFVETMVGTNLAIHFHRGSGFVSRDNVTDYLTIPLSLFITFALLGCLFLPLPFIFLRQRHVLKYGRIHRAEVLDTYYEKAVDIRFEVDGKSMLRRVSIISGFRPPIGSHLWILEDGSKFAPTVIRDNFLWECIPA